MLALIGDFKFDINTTNFEKLKRSISFGFVKHARVGNFDSYQAIGEYEEKIDVEGTLIAKSQKQLRDFELLGRKKEPVTLVLPDGTAKTIIIMDLEEDKSSFLRSGEFLKQVYKTSLQVVEDNDQ
ncbi:phage tail protein [Malaciobacter canalis]|uniref:phage tail protein n=1 Tax=Malaciobacter canalis TaxID=1912871 RepID=UPI0013FD1F6B|nr:phage tail protein [Malaciobacter canalis]QEE32442.1 phage P2 GpU family protein [Malaciobacter canalis]